MSDIIMLIITVVLAAICAFFGYKFHKLLITLCWFAIGSLLVGTILGNFINNSSIVYIIAIVTGILIGFLGTRIEKAGVFAICFLSVLLVSYIYVDQEILKWIIGIAGGIIGGILGIKFLKATIICFTAFTGSQLAINSILKYFKFENKTISIIALVVVTLIAIYYQYHTNKKAKEDK